MQDGSDAVSDWPLLNALLNTASGATWVSLHHGGGVGMGYSQHAGMVIVADGTPEAAARLERVLWNDPATGVMRHADAGYEIAKDWARRAGPEPAVAGGLRWPRRCSIGAPAADPGRPARACWPAPCAVELTEDAWRRRRGRRADHRRHRRRATRSSTASTPASACWPTPASRATTWRRCSATWCSATPPASAPLLPDADRAPDPGAEDRLAGARRLGHPAAPPWRRSRPCSSTRSIPPSRPRARSAPRATWRRWPTCPPCCSASARPRSAARVVPAAEGLRQGRPEAPGARRPRKAWRCSTAPRSPPPSRSLACSPPRTCSPPAIVAGALSHRRAEGLRHPLRPAHPRPARPARPDRRGHGAAHPDGRQRDPREPPRTTAPRCRTPIRCAASRR